MPNFTRIQSPLRLLLVILAILLVLRSERLQAQTQIFAAPLAPVYGTIGNPVTFNATLISTPIPQVSQFLWDFGDGQTAYGQIVSHTYFAPGVYTVSVTALASNGPIATTSTTASISQRSGGVVSVAPGVNSVPVPLGFVGVNAGGPYSGIAGQPIALQGTASNAAAPQFEWNFGDGQTGAGATVSHSYTAPGTYSIRLTVTDLATGTTGAATTAAAIGATSAPIPVPLPATGLGPGPTGPSVSYPAGWNLIAGPAGTAFPQALSPIFTWRSGDTSYELQSSATGVQGGAGYWAFFPQPATVTLSGQSSDSISVPVPPGQMVLIGNPNATQAVVIHGADSALIWDGLSSQYRSVQSLAPGAGAWVSLAAGGTISLSP